MQQRLIGPKCGYVPKASSKPSVSSCGRRLAPDCGAAIELESEAKVLAGNSANPLFFVNNRRLGISIKRGKTTNWMIPEAITKPEGLVVPSSLRNSAENYRICGRAAQGGQPGLQ